MADERWIGLADRIAALVWGLFGQLRWWLVWDIRSVLGLIVLVSLLLAVAFVLVGYLRGDLREDKE